MIELNDVSLKVAALLFRMKGHKDGRLYVAGREDMEWLEFANRYSHGAARVEYNFESDGDKFFLVWTADCYDPPVIVIRARHEVEALEIFLDEFKSAWVSKEDEEDYVKEERENHICYNNSGQMCNTENVGMREAELVGLEFMDSN